MNDFRSDLAGAAIGAMTGGAVLVVGLLSLRNRLAVAGERIERRGPAALCQDWQNGQGKNKTDHQGFGWVPLHGFFSAAGARSGKPKARMLVPDAIARY